MVALPSLCLTAVDTIYTIQVISGAYPLDVAVYHELKQVIPSGMAYLCDRCIIHYLN